MLATLPLLVLPWLNPFTSGPNSTVFPFLLAWGCTAVALLWWSALALTDTQRLQTVALAWLVAACVSAALGLLQYFDISRDWAPWVNQPGLGQAFGNLRQRNQFATLCSIGLAALWWCAQHLGAQQTNGLTPRRMGAVASAALLAALLAAATAASGSRTGLVELVVLAALALWWTRVAHAAPAPQTKTPDQAQAQHGWHWLFAVALLAYLLAALVLPKQVGAEGSALDRLGDSTGSGRRVLWANVWQLVLKKPWLGWGWGDLEYAHFITLFDGPRFPVLLGNAHNLPLQLAVELGLPLALLFCAVVLWWTKRQRPWRERRPERQLAWGVLAVIGVHSLLEYPLWYAQFQVAALLCLWALWVFPAVPRAERATRWGAPAALAGTAIALAVAGASWCYWRASQPYLAPEERAAIFRGQSWAQLRDIWLFSEQVGFAQLAVTPVTPANAAAMRALATDLLHFSPEPMVVKKLLQSAQMQGQNEVVVFYARRFQAAYPAEYAQWVKEQ